MQGVPTLESIAKSLNPDGTIAMPADIISQTNEILRDAPMLEGNLPTGHRETLVTELPNAYWARYYKGTPVSRTVKQQVTDDIGMLKSRSRIDYDLAQLNGMSRQWRLQEDRPHIEALGETLASTLFYGDHLNSADEFNGLTQRYSTIDDQVIDCGGTSGSLASIWLVGWGPNTVNLRYPKGQPQSGIIQTDDIGKVTVDDSDGNPYEVLDTLYKSNLGLSVKDYRYVVRLCNIPVASVTAAGSTYNLWNNLIDMIHRLPNMNNGDFRFYMNRTLLSLLDKQSFNISNIQLSPMELTNGEKPMAFRKVPFRLCDALVNDEDLVS